MIFELIFDAKMEGLEKQPKRFRIIHVAKYEFSTSCEVEKIDAKRGPQNQ